MTVPEPEAKTPTVQQRLTLLATDLRLVAVARGWVLSVFDDADFIDMFTGPHPDGRYQVALVTADGFLIDVVLRSEDDFEFNVFDLDLFDGLTLQGDGGEPETDTTTGKPKRQTLAAVSAANTWNIVADDQATIEALGAFHRRLTRWWVGRRGPTPRLIGGDPVG
ncbi:MAG: hypothetical protein O7C01_04525 [Actinobacteria bacterium]|nr:hypothetical protein [Actinomycetota bacterium]